MLTRKQALSGKESLFSINAASMVRSTLLGTRPTGGVIPAADKTPRNSGSVRVALQCVIRGMI